MTQTNLKSQLIDIINGDLLLPIFQPIFNLRAADIHGFEALIRGPVNSALHKPSALFSTADEHGLQKELEYACSSASIERYKLLGAKQNLFINVSPMAYRDGYQNAEAINAFRDLDIDASKVVIELSEQYPMDDFSTLKRATEFYRQQGYKIAIDDLGAGYGSLRIWEELRPDYVKIDKHFIEKIDQDNVKRKIVSSIVMIAEAVGCSVIAEGVETDGQLHLLNNLGVEFAQGYHLRRPTSRIDDDIPSSLLIAHIDTPSEGIGHPIRHLAETCPSILARASFDDVLTVFRRDDAIFCLPVTENDQVIGAIFRHDVFETAQSRRDNTEQPILKASCLMSDDVIIIDSSMSMEYAGELLSNKRSDADMLTHFVIVDAKRLVGIGKTINLLAKLTEYQLKAAVASNPLTRLPGNTSIDRTLHDWLVAEHSFVTCYFDLNNFKPFNDNKGYKSGDEVIIELSKIIHRHIVPGYDFIGHVGGDDFVVLFRSEDWEARCQQILVDFDKDVLGFYTMEEIKRGGIKAIDRRGNPCFYPLLSLAIGAVMADVLKQIDAQQLISLVTDAKSQAKKCDTSQLFINRRLPSPALTTL